MAQFNHIEVDLPDWKDRSSIELVEAREDGAPSGSIVISPETYALVQEDVQAGAAGCLLTEEFHDSDLAQASITSRSELPSTYSMTTADSAFRNS